MQDDKQKHWTLTHIPSGKSVGERFKTLSKRRAVAMCKRVAAAHPTIDLSVMAQMTALAELLASG